MQSAQAFAPMRHTFLCSIVAILAAFLTPIICLLLLFIFMPKIFDGDVLAWSWAFGGVQAFLGLLLTITIIVGFVAFLVAKVKLPDRERFVAQGCTSRHLFTRRLEEGCDA
jgi:hypothetical protein